MKIYMEYKYQPEEYASRTFGIELVPEDIGLSHPVHQTEYEEVLKLMQFEAAKACNFWLLKEGHVDQDSVLKRLKVYK